MRSPAGAIAGGRSTSFRSLTAEHRELPVPYVANGHLLERRMR